MSDWTKYCEPSNWHEAANLFPLLPSEELTKLATDISDHGLSNPVTLLEDKVLDGRNRVLACQIAGIIPKFNEWQPNSTVSPIIWVISQNLHRRHLDAGQRAAVAVEAKPLLAAQAKENQSLSKGIAPVKTGEARFLKNEKPSSNPIKTEKDVADQFDVSQGYVYAAEQIKDRDESVFQRVKSGELSIPEAQRELGIKQNAKNIVSSNSNEWYTPKEYIDAARNVLGAFDLDPASCSVANKIIKAKKFFSENEDGLEQTWNGKIWLNPPYGNLGGKFVTKLIQEYDKGNVKEAILLVNAHCTDTKWFQPLWDHRLCFTDHRIDFWTESDKKEEEKTTSTHGSVLVYLGNDYTAFKDNFRQFGRVVKSDGQ